MSEGAAGDRGAWRDITALTVEALRWRCLCIVLPFVVLVACASKPATSPLALPSAPQARSLAIGGGGPTGGICDVDPSACKFVPNIGSNVLAELYVQRRRSVWHNIASPISFSSSSLATTGPRLPRASNAASESSEMILLGPELGFSFTF